jgi:hypothetical protein
LEGEEGLYIFPNKIQSIFEGKTLGEGEFSLKFKFLGFKKVGKFRQARLDILD